MQRSSSAVRRRRSAAPRQKERVAGTVADILGIAEHEQAVRCVLRLLANRVRVDGTQFNESLVQSVIERELEAAWHGEDGAQAELVSIASSVDARSKLIGGSFMILEALESRFGNAVLLDAEPEPAKSEQLSPLPRPSHFRRFLTGLFGLVLWTAFFHATFEPELLGEMRREAFATVLVGVSKADPAGAAWELWSLLYMAAVSSSLSLVVLVLLGAVQGCCCCCGQSLAHCLTDVVIVPAGGRRAAGAAPPLLSCCSVLRHCVCRSLVCCCLEDLLAPTLFCACYDGTVPSERCCGVESVIKGSWKQDDARVGGGP